MKTKLTMIMLIAGFLCADAQEWTWSEDQLSVAREGISATAMDDSIFFSQGRLYSTAFVHTIDIYEVDEDVWTSYESQSNARWNTVSVSCNGMVFIAGGNNWPQGANFSDVDIYTKATGEWTIEYLSVARSLIGATAHMNKVFFGGGMFWGTNVAFYDVIDIYDAETKTWSEPLYLTEPKAAVGVVAAGGKVFFAGGAPALGVGTDLVEIYDIETGDWTYDTLSQARSFPACVAYGNKVYFAGGALPNAFSSDVVDIYNIDTEEWEDSQTLSFPRIVRALKVKDALVFAGETDFISSNGYFGPANGIIDIYYPETDEWSYLVPDLNPARIWYGCAVYDDKAYFGGGWPGGSSLTDDVSILEVIITGVDTPKDKFHDFPVRVNPNPFSSTILVNYNLQQSGKINIAIYNNIGEKVAVLVNEYQLQGNQEIIFNTKKLKPGIYFCVLKTSEGIQTRKIVKL